MKKTFTSRIKLYYRLTKPGIIYGNLITAAGGFLFASRGHVDIGLMLLTMLGIAFVIAAACVVNNVIDRNIDRKMDRTKKRALATGSISVSLALIYASVLAIVGIGVLVVYTNMLTVRIGLGALFSYIVMYGFAKRHTVHGTLVGTIPGAASIVAGYTAVTNQLNKAAIILFLILVFWQMAHFYSIAIYRLKDYKSAGIPVLPAKSGVHITKAYILLYIVAFTAAAFSLSAYGHISYVFSIGMAMLGAWWLYLGARGLRAANDDQWARQMFRFSLVVILGMSLMLSVDSMLQ